MPRSISVGLRFISLAFVAAPARPNVIYGNENHRGPRPVIPRRSHESIRAGQPWVLSYSHFPLNGSPAAVQLALQPPSLREHDHHPPHAQCNAAHVKNVAMDSYDNLPNRSANEFALLLPSSTRARHLENGINGRF